jgi:phage recombination protein Bet
VTDLEVIPPADLYPKPAPLSIAQIDAVRNQLATGLTDAELDLFVSIANRSGLDPFGRQIWAYKRGDKLVIQASIDGLRLIALRTGLYGGQLPVKWCGPDRIWQEVWLEKEPPAAAMVAVIRKDYPTPTTAVAVFDSYAARDRNGHLMNVWASAPDVMIAKCGEALALRKAFPAETAGLYVSGEIPVDDPVPVNAAELDPPATTNEDRGPLRHAIEHLSDAGHVWALGQAKAHQIPNIDGPQFRRSHRNELAWFILVAQQIKPAPSEQPAGDEPDPEAA